MVREFFHAKLLLQRLAIALLLFSLCRILFFLFNHSVLPEISAGTFLLILFYGLRFDVSAIIYINSLFILLHLLPFPFRNLKYYQNIQKIIFISFNSFVLLFEVADFAYFRFTHKRTTADIFYIASDVANLLPQYLKDFWYLLLIWCGMILLSFFLYKKTETKNFPQKTNFFFQTILLIFYAGIFLVGARGGLQFKPITPITAANYVEVPLTPLVTNTTFNILQSIEHRGVVEKNYFSEGELKKIFSTFHFPKDTISFKADNVVIIVMESFSKEYVKTFNGRTGFTPFIDTMIGKSLVCTNAFANAVHSNEGLAAITSSIPSLMNDPMMISAYQNNKIDGIGNLLKQENYRTAFFHGADNGSMSLDYFSKSAGFDEYFGRKEYNNDLDYDGSWGIYDEPFFQFTAKKLNEFSQPFCAVLFSTSSHHPFKIPEKYRYKFKEKISLYESVRYADFSLQRFFETVSKNPWFKNTLFVITADHTGVSHTAIYQNSVGNFKIPVLFYKPDGSLKSFFEKPFQQIDIMPTILDFLNFDKNYFSFGKSIFDTVGRRFAYNYNNGIYQILDDNFVLQFDGEKSIALFDYKNDMFLKKNLLVEKTEVAKELENKIKAVIQTYNYSMIHNELTVK